MNAAEANTLLQAQKQYFRSGRTLPIKARKAALTRLYDTICTYEDRICAALHKDLGKSRSESYMCEIGIAKTEITYMRTHIGTLAKERRVPTPLSQFAARSYIKPSPYGCVLIMSPWNYPFLLAIEPMVDAIAAGNTVIIKPSAYSPAVSALLAEMIAACFPREHAAVVTGGRAENTFLLEMDFDYIFFTGSQRVGKLVMSKAAEKLIPVSLELGGKSPCIVDRTADIPLAAKRIVFGKLLNSGQTCVAPDYICCDETVKDRLIAEIIRQIKVQFGEEPLKNPAYGQIVNQKHFARICGLIDPEKTVCGGTADAENRRIAPTVLDRVTWDDPVMQEEIFGPVLPVMTYRSLDELIALLQTKPAPLALYLFTSCKKTVGKVTSLLSFGGGCINDTMIHLASTALPFGGVGSSGMGAYHGKKGFETFTHEKSIVDKKTWLDLPMRYQPYSPLMDKLVRMFLR